MVLNLYFGDKNIKFITYLYGVYKIDKDGFQFRSERNSEWLDEDGSIVKNFIAGIGTIEKLPPKFVELIRIAENNDKYLYVNVNGVTHETYFVDSYAADLYRRKAGNMFPAGSKLPKTQIDKIVKEMKE